MPPVTLEGDTLGEKHLHFNKLVVDAIADKRYELRNIRADDSDIDNLLKIGIACKTRNIDYIIKVMKSNDMLYAATAIKKSTWLITEQQYAHIINPEYLHTQLLPSMNPKSFNKLMLHIRLNLKDETRVEAFYEYLKETDSAYKWLEHCSIPFIENVLKNGRLIPLSLYKRLCKRSAHFLAYYESVESRHMYEVKQAILLLLKSHTTEVLDVLEDKKKHGYIPPMGKKKTKILMKKCTTRVLDNFDKYADIIDLSMVAKYIQKNEIKAFLCKHGSKLLRLNFFDTLKNFIKNMPEEERFEFVQSTFLDKTEMALIFSDSERSRIERCVNTYQWYEFAPFDVAFPEMKTLIRRENSSSKRCAMLSVLITCTQNKLQDIKTLLIFYNEKHINEPLKFKIRFVNNLLSQISTHEFDAETWNILDQLFHSMDVYTEPNYSVEQCLYSIVAYKVLHDEPVPEIVEQNMTYDSFEEVQSKLNQEQKNKLFTYLFNFMLSKIQSNEDISNEGDAQDNLLHLENTIRLLRDWNKNICDFPVILEEIQKFIQIVHQHMWQTDMSYLYNIQKSWRKHMFEESLSLNLGEETCLNALKHKPQLLMQHDKEVDTLRTNDAVSLRRLLAKLRVYWSHSYAQHWIQAFLFNLSIPARHKAAIKGLFILYPQNEIIDMATKYAPENFKINRSKMEQGDLFFSIQKYIAENLHIARPLVSLDTVLLYAKGNHLQYAVPSLNAIMDNMSEIVSREHLSKLLNVHILQKFGLHLVYLKFSSDDLISIYSEVWNTTENISLQFIMFNYTYERMCKVKNPVVEKELWKLLSFFMDHVFSGATGHVEKVPISVRAEYYMKCWKLSALQRNNNFRAYVNDLIKCTPNIMDILENDFVENQILSPVGSKFCSYESKFIEIFACYVLFGKSQEHQLERFRRVVEPAMGEAFQLWDSVHLGNYYIRNNFEKFMKLLVWNFKLYFSIRKIPIPVKLFLAINAKMEKDLPTLQNYVILTSLKLLTEYLKIMDEDDSATIVMKQFNFSESNITNGQMSRVMENLWKYFHLKTSLWFGPMVVHCLKNDTMTYGHTIHDLFADAFQKMFEILVCNNKHFEYVGSVLQTLLHMLDDNDFIPNYLVVSKVTPKHCSDGELKLIQSEIREKLRSHPSKTVLLHYFTDFRNVPEDVLQASSERFKLHSNKKWSCELI